MTEAAKELASSGAIGAAFVMALLMLFWLMRVLVKNATKQMEAMGDGMRELVEQSRAIRDNCMACRSDSVSTLRDAQEHIVAKLWEVKKEAVADVAKVFDAANKEAENTRLRDEVSRPHIVPPPSGVVR